MAGSGRGRGRGRGRSAFTFNIEDIGLVKGEALPEAVFNPSPLYPTTDFKPIPVKTGEEEDYLVALKQEFRASVRKTPYFISKVEEDQGVERYSQKYLKIDQDNLEWTPDWRRLPREMKPKKRIKKAGGNPKKAKTTVSKTNVDVLKKLEELEKKGDGEKSDEEEQENEKKKDEDEEEADKPEEYEEEEYEEENDYIASYFEAGDDYGASSDDNMDEATY